MLSAMPLVPVVTCIVLVFLVPMLCLVGYHRNEHSEAKLVHENLQQMCLRKLLHGDLSVIMIIPRTLFDNPYYICMFIVCPVQLQWILNLTTSDRTTDETSFGTHSRRLGVAANARYIPASSVCLHRESHVLVKRRTTSANTFIFDARLLRCSHA